MAWKEYPFTGGQYEGADARLLPEGTLSSMRNLQQLKDGRWGKRRRYDAVTAQSKHTGSDAAVPANSVLSLGAREQDRLVLTGEPCLLYNYAADRNRMLPYDPDYNGAVWAPPTFAAPTKVVVNSQVDSDDPDVTQIADSASRNDYTVVASLNSEQHLIAQVYSEPDGVFVHEDTLSTAADIGNVQVKAIGTIIMVLWSEGTTLKFDRLAAANQQGLHAFTGSPVTVGTMTSATSRPALQASKNSVTSSEAALIVYQSGTDDIACQRWESPWATATVSTSYTASAVGTLRPNVFADDDLAVSWVVWVNEVSGDVEFIKATHLFGSPGSPVLIDGSGTPLGQPIIDGDAATPRAIVAWHNVNASVEPSIRQAYLTTTASTPDDYWGWQLVSNFLPDPYGDVTVHYAVATPARSASSLVRKSYYLLRFNFGELTTTLKASGIVHARFGEGSVDETGLFEIARPHLHTTTNGEILFAWKQRLQTLGETVSAWRFKATGFDRGHPALHGGGLYYPAAMTWRWDGVEPRAAMFPEAPEIISLTAGTAGSLTQLATYGYIAVYEREEHDGSVSLSTPSEAVSITLTGAEDSVEIKLRSDPTIAGRTRVRIYRTLANGSVYFYEKTLALGLGWLDEGPSQVGSIADDDTIEATHILYTQVGSVLGNDPPEGCRFIARVGRRLWQGGLEDPYRVRSSKTLFAGESASFPAVEEYSVVVAEPVLGLGGLDSTPVVFTRNTITAVLGPGPDDAGLGLYEPREVPCNSGLVAWGHRSLAECTHGLVYQAVDGIFLLPRGFGPPEFIGHAIRDTLAAYPYVTSAVVVHGAQELRLTAVDDLDDPSAGVALIWDLRTKAWIIADVDPDNTPHVCAADWGGTHAIARETMPSGVYLENDTAYLTSEHLESSLATGDVRPGDVAAYGRCREVQLLLEWRAACSVYFELSTDGGVTWPYESEAFDLSGGGYATGDTVELKWHLPVQKATRFRLRFRDTHAGSGTAGVIYLGVSFDLRQKSGGARLPVGKRS